jgi:hypothetical protein
LTVWYPLADRVVDLQDINNRFKVNSFELTEVIIDDAFPEGADLHQDTIDTITENLPTLKSRLSSETARRPDVAMVLSDDAPNWPYIYQALFMGQLINSGDEKWQFYRAFEYELPSDDDLKSIKAIIFPGSGHAVYNEHKVAWITDLKHFIRRILNEHPHIKIIGGCFGE